MGLGASQRSSGSLDDCTHIVFALTFHLRCRKGYCFIDGVATRNTKTSAYVRYAKSLSVNIEQHAKLHYLLIEERVEVNDERFAAVVRKFDRIADHFKSLTLDAMNLKSHGLLNRSV